MAMRWTAVKKLVGCFTVLLVCAAILFASGVLDRSASEAAQSSKVETASVGSGDKVPTTSRPTESRSFELERSAIGGQVPILKVTLPSNGEQRVGTPAPQAASSAPLTTTPSETSTTETSTTVSKAATSQSATSQTTVETTARESTSPPETQSTSTTVSLSQAEISEIERHIFDWINMFRQDPAGPLRRTKPMPACLLLDPAIELGESGHPIAVGPLRLDDAVSETISRAWAQSMADQGAMVHRGHNDQVTLYDQLEIPYWAFAESVARANPRYSTSEIALLLFESWRESDGGHYCPMVTPTFSHIGVGYHLSPDGQHWAALNFYAVN